MEHPLDTVFSQFQDSPTLVRLIENFNAYVDPNANLDAFYDLMWNVNTAQGYGLDVWGRIVGVSRVLPVTQQPMSFGFDDGVNDFAPFGQAPFYPGAPLTTNYALSDAAFRTLIFVKALANITSCASPALNRLITLLFAGRGRAYVNDLGGMTMRYTFEFQLTAPEVAILTGSGAVPHGTGVQTQFLVVPVPTTFGFSEAGTGVAPFGQGTFLSSEALFYAD